MRLPCIALITLLLMPQVGQAFDHQYRALDAFLKKKVKVEGSTADIEILSSKEDRTLLKQILDEIGKVKQKEFNRWTDKQKMAFLINAFNAYEIFHKKERRKDGGLHTELNRPEFVVEIFGKKVKNLEVKDQFAIQTFKDPRLLFAFYDPRTVCPMLRNEAWQSARLDEQLADSIRLFFSEPKRIFVNQKERVIKVAFYIGFMGKFEHFRSAELARFVAKHAGLDSAVQKDIEEHEYQVWVNTCPCLAKGEEDIQCLR